MTGKNARQNVFLRLVSGNGVAFGAESRYLLPTSREVVIGRDPSCEIVLDAMMCRMVSRRHAIIRPISSSPDGEDGWTVCDLESANGTYLNGKRLQGCQQLMPGDLIGLAQDGPKLIFEREVNEQPTVLSQVAVSPLPPANGYQQPISTANYSPAPKDSISFTQLFPIISTGKDLTRKAYLIPGIITIIFVVLMFATIEQPQLNQFIVATFIALAAYYFFIYLLCGKHKPWWVLLASALTTILILVSPILDLFFFVFRVILPGSMPANQSTTTFTELLVRMFFGAGLMEELLKALPILGAHMIAKVLPSPWKERIGVWEPLDGILLGTASAVGFTLLETLGQYVPQFSQSIAQQAGLGDGLFAGFRLLIPRILGSLPGHMAYSGYLGYFIGLAVLKPTKSLQILLVGYLTAASLHALWNATGVINGLLLIIVGVLSYAFLMAAILKARALSPTRAQNFATRFLGPK